GGRVGEELQGQRAANDGVAIRSVVDGARGPGPPEPQRVIERRLAAVPERGQHRGPLLLEGDGERARLAGAQSEGRAGAVAPRFERLFRAEREQPVARVTADSEVAPIPELHLALRESRAGLERRLDAHLAPARAEGPHAL